MEERNSLITIRHKTNPVEIFGFGIFLLFSFFISISFLRLPFGLFVFWLPLWPAICVVLSRFFWRVDLDTINKKIIFNKTLRSKTVSPDGVFEWGVWRIKYSGSSNWVNKYFVRIRLKDHSVFEYPILGERVKTIGLLKKIIGLEPKEYEPKEERVFWDIVFEMKNLMYVFPEIIP